MSRLWLVRHGPTHAKAFVGWTDLPADLSDRNALSRLSAALPQVPVISSDLDRAVKTADAIMGTRPRLSHDPRLRETHFGSWENRKWSDLSTTEQEDARAVFDTPGDTRPPGGESWNQLSARVQAAAADLPGETIIVAHMGVIMALLQHALGGAPQRALAQTIDPLSCTIIDRASNDTASWRASGINHLY